MTPFTPEQVAFIERIVDARLLANQKPISGTSKNYHSAVEIKMLIMNNIAEIRDWFGEREFDIASFRDFLARKTTLRHGDLEPLSSEKNGIRWNTQVTNALKLEHWPDCPVVPGSKRRAYRLIQEQQLSLQAPTICQ